MQGSPRIGFETTPIGVRYNLTKDLPSGDIKTIASKLTTLSNEKMKEEKAAEKGGKKSKAAKTKTSLVASRDESFRADTTSYENEFDE